MAKEWDKFSSDYKKMKPGIEKYSASAVSAVYKRLGLADASLSEGESNLAESTVDARKAGVTGASLPDFMKNKAFADAKKLLDKAVGMFVEALNDLDSFCTEAGKLSTEVGALYTKIEKDLKSRKDKATNFTRSLPGAPDGQYAVLQFDTSFENKAQAVETLTAVLEADGVWRVTGYFIR